jgi:probable HAF family extracellular repeat protein
MSRKEKLESRGLYSIVLLIALCLFSMTVSAGTLSFYTPLLPNGWYSGQALAINNNGVVVGVGLDSTSNYRGFIYSAGTYTELLPPGWLYGSATAININDVVAGTGYDGSAHKSFIYSAGAYSPLLPTGWVDAEARAINDNGVIVGFGDDGSGKHRGFLYSGGAYTKLLPPGWNYALAMAINNNGVVVGLGNDGSVYKGFIYNAGAYTELLPPGWVDAAATAINDKGIVVGYGHDGTIGKGFIYDGVTYTPLLPPGWAGIDSAAINNNGVVVGRGYDGSVWTGFIYNDGLYAPLLPAGWEDSYPTGISDREIAVGWGSDGTTVRWFMASGSTPAGSGVTVQPIDPITGKTPVTITFTSVTTSGVTSLATTSTGTPPPAGFKLGDPPTYYSIETTAGYSGPIHICIDYSSISYGSEKDLKLFHWSSTTQSWQDVTDPGYPDTVKKIICGTITSFSFFGVFEPSYQYSFTGFLPPVENPPAVNAAKAKSTIPVKWQLADGNGGYISDLSAVTSITFQQIACSDLSTALTSEIQATASDDSGLHYDAAANQFVYNWKTNSTMVGKCYVLILKLNDGSQYRADFSLK